MTADTQAMEMDRALVELVALVAGPDESVEDWVERAVRCQLERERDEVEIAVPIPEKVRRRAALEAKYYDADEIDIIDESVAISYEEPGPS